MFEKAARLKVRFNHKGLSTVEDLWDMPLASLDAIFKTLNAQNKAQKEESLLEARSQEDEVLALKIAIIKHVVAVRIQEQKDREGAADRAARKQKVLGIIARKQDAALESLSVEELTKLVEGL